MPTRVPAACRLPESAVIGVLALVATMVVWASFTMAASGEPPRDYRRKCSDVGCHLVDGGDSLRMLIEP